MTGWGYVHSLLLPSQARQVVLGPVLTHLTFDLLQRTQAIEDRMFFTGESMAAVDFLWARGTFWGCQRGLGGV